MAVLSEKVIELLQILLQLFEDMLTNPLIQGFAVVLLVFAIICLVMMLIGAFRRR